MTRKETGWGLGSMWGQMRDQRNGVVDSVGREGAEEEEGTGHAAGVEQRQEASGERGGVGRGTRGRAGSRAGRAGGRRTDGRTERAAGRGVEFAEGRLPSPPSPTHRRGCC